MAKTPEWKIRLYKKASGLGPFKFQNQRYLALRQQWSYFAFRKKFLNLAGKPATELQRKAIIFIFEKCIQLRAERDTFHRANQLVNNTTWKRDRKDVVHLIALLRAYSDTGLETYLARSLAKKNAEGSRKEAKELIRKLLELQYECNWWERFSKIRTWGEYYRDAVLGIDSYLRRRYTDFTRRDRADIICAALNVMQLKESASAQKTKEVFAETIIRMLNRRRKT